jgi:serine/threonine protein kinase
MDVAVGDTLSHYRLLERVDGGGQGTVFKAKDLRLDRDVALKVLPEHALSDQGARRRFQKEARALSLLSHPNIQVIHDFDTQDGVDFLVSEYIPGLTLKEKLSSNGSFSEQDLARLGLQITEGLACAHEHGVVHRDLSAKNLILTPGGHLKIVDFGLARVVRLPSETETTETLTASIAGTLPYMSPEQLAGQADARSDIYGVGVLLYQMATGRLPFAGLQGPALVAAIHAQPPPLPTRVNPRLTARMEDVLLKCLQKDPDRRYQSARELTVDLRRILEPWPVPRPRAHRLLWSFLGVLVLAGLLIIAKATKHWPFAGGFRFDHPAMAAVANSPVKEQGSRISPDGAWISFLGDRSGKPTLWRRHVSGGEPEAIVTESGNILSQAWSPNGLEIAYLHLVNGEVFLKIQSAFGGPASMAMPVNVRYKDAKIARWIGSGLFLDVPRSGLWRLDRRTGKEVNVLASVANSEYREQFDVSGDGKNAAYVKVDGSQTSIWVSGLNGKETRPITRPGESVSAPRWLGHRGVMYVSDRGGQPDIWFQNEKGGDVRQITFSTAAEDLEDVSANGALVTFTLESESGGLWRMNLNVPEPGTQVTPGSPVDFWPVQTGDRVVFQKMKPGMEGAVALFNNGIYIAPLNELNDSGESRLLVERGAFPLPSPSGRYVTFMREPAARGWELWVHDLVRDHDTRLCDDFHPPDLFMQPLSFLSVNEAWSPSGDSLFAVGMMDRAPVLRQFLMRSPETPTALARAQEGQTLSDLFVSPEGSRLAYVIATPGPSHQWEIRVCDLTARTDTVWFTDTGADFQRFLLRGWLGRDRLLILRVHINPDWTNRLEFVEVVQDQARSLSTVDNAFDGTVQIDRATGVIYLVRLDEPGGSANIYGFDPARDRLIRITNNTSPSITFAGLDLSNPGSLFYSMVDHNQDIWRVEFEGNKRSRKERD